MRFVAVDVETTGLAAQRGDRVIEIGAVMLSESGPDVPRICGDEPQNVQGIAYVRG